MKVKEFDTYRPPRRKPWGAMVLVLVLASAGYWFFIREKPEPRPRRSPVKRDVSEPQAASPRRSERSRSPEPTMVPLEGDVRQWLQEGDEAVKAGQLVQARQAYLNALRHIEDAQLRRDVEKRLEPINIELLLSPRPMPEKKEYLVRRGDSLGVIANRNGTTTLLLQKNNRLMNPNLIKAGDRLLVFTGSFEMEASKSARDLVVYMNGEFFKRYPVGTGLYGRTPVGTFVVRDKIAEPTWWPPDGREVPYGHEDNILGTRWMSVRAAGDTPDVRGYGIHGTWEPESVGHESSAGCLRMLNADVEELFIYIPSGTPLRITE